MRGGLALLTVLALACAAPSAGRDATHDAAGLVFVQETWTGQRSAPPRRRVCAVGAQGQTPTPLTSGEVDQQPAISPVRDEVAFTRGTFGTGRLYRAPASGEAVVVRADMIAYWPAWAPDGSRIVFASPGPDNAPLTAGLDIYSVAPDGSDLRRLTTAPGRDTMPSVSPDGQRLAFVRGQSDLGGGELYVAAIDGTGERRAASLSGVTRPSWFPGHELVFAAGGSVWRLPVDGDGPTVPLAPGSDPSVSPDGTRVALVRDGDVWTMRADGSEQVNATHSPLAESEPAWLRSALVAPAERRCAIVGTLENDVLVGTEGDDDFYDIAGNDVIDGRGGNDRIFDGPGDDEIRGGDGNDEVVLAEGANRVAGGEGNDLLTAQRYVATRDLNVLAGEGGDDSIFGGLVDDQLSGGLGNDTIFGARGRDVIDGGPGRDRIEGNADDDSITGGAGDDTLFGGVRYTGPRGVLNGNDLLAGGAGADFLAGGPGLDDLRGGTGRDRLVGGSGADRLLGDAGFDVLDGESGDDLLLARDRAPDDLRGGAGRDSARVDRGLDLLVGLERLLP